MAKVVEYTISNEKKKVYDVNNVRDNHNFIIYDKSLTKKIIAHNCALLDELSFTGSSVDKEKALAAQKDIHSGLTIRIGSRYTDRYGNIIGRIYIASSKNLSDAYLENHIKDVKRKGLTTTKIVDIPKWLVDKAQGNYVSDETFVVLVGNKYLESRYPIPGEDVTELENMGYKILNVPMNYKTRFDLDLEKAIQDVAGESLDTTRTYMKREDLAINKDIINLMKVNEIKVGLDDNFEIKDFLVKERISPWMLRCPGYIRFDLSKNQDATGFSFMIATPLIETITELDGTKRDIQTYKAIPLIAMRLQPRKGMQVPYSKIMEFIEYLRTLGFYIRCISADQYQSVGQLQYLRARNFNIMELSVDRDKKAYNYLKQSFVQGKVEIFPHIILEKELLELEDTGRKIDHPSGGSKDIADTISGNLYSMVLDKDILYHIREVGEPLFSENIKTIEESFDIKDNLKNIYNPDNLIDITHLSKGEKEKLLKEVEDEPGFY